jgi:hypothetical protein
MVKCAGVLLEPREFPCDLVYSIPINAIEGSTSSHKKSTLKQCLSFGCLVVMLEKVEENHFVGAFSIVLTITAVTLNTSCND